MPRLQFVSISIEGRLRTELPKPLELAKNLVARLRCTEVRAQAIELVRYRYSQSDPLPLITPNIKLNQKLRICP